MPFLGMYHDLASEIMRIDGILSIYLMIYFGLYGFIQFYGDVLYVRIWGWFDVSFKSTGAPRL